ncbi:hypothetical protein QP185_18305 [Sphingomonas aerolata]|uniref:hypothetical protein n=1 Tax=Sphingomonas aerolata TaxID=185951 RepID=UPI002FDFC5B6
MPFLAARREAAEHLTKYRFCTHLSRLPFKRFVTHISQLLIDHRDEAPTTRSAGVPATRAFASIAAA